MITYAPFAETFGTFIYSNQASIFCLERNQILEIFKDKGAILFRDFNLSLIDFKSFSSLFCDHFMPYRGGAIPREVIDNDNTVLSVTGNHLKYAVSLHGEMYYMDERPDLLWFYCNRPAQEGGETTLCDGAEFLRHLQPSTQRFFENNRLKYRRIYPLQIWQKMYQTEDLSVLDKICQANNIRYTYNKQTGSLTTESIQWAVHSSPGRVGKVFINNILPILDGIVGQTSSWVMLEDDSEIPKSICQEIRQVAEKITFPVVWQAGDLLMVDNTRLLHGRRAYIDDHRSIYVRLGKLLCS
ncbi:MAG: TauD/TfdA family dioxygenase [Cyanobacteriota bacterium]|nr:TauD/TfdA family dioxygenase [Cyanobacteriota bacterium]